MSWTAADRGKRREFPCCTKKDKISAVCAVQRKTWDSVPSVIVDRLVVSRGEVVDNVRLLLHH
jgi:hypothetical protein